MKGLIQSYLLLIILLVSYLTITNHQLIFASLQQLKYFLYNQKLQYRQHQEFLSEMLIKPLEVTPSTLCSKSQQSKLCYLQNGFIVKNNSKPEKIASNPNLLLNFDYYQEETRNCLNLTVGIKDSEVGIISPKTCLQIPSLQKSDNFYDFNLILDNWAPAAGTVQIINGTLAINRLQIVGPTSIVATGNIIIEDLLINPEHNLVILSLTGTVHLRHYPEQLEQQSLPVSYWEFGKYAKLQHPSIRFLQNQIIGIEPDKI